MSFAGYGRMPYEPQPAGLGPEAKSTGKYGKNFNIWIWEILYAKLSLLVAGSSFKFTILHSQ